MRMRTFPGLLFILASFACAGADSSETAWQTVVDTLGDTIVVRTVGAESPPRHGIVTEVRIGELEGPDEYTFGSISDVVVAPDDAIYIFDSQAMQIRRYDTEGKFVQAVGRKGGGPGEYDRINGMDVGPNGRLYVWDAGNARIAMYTPHGEDDGSWRVQGGFFTNDALMVDSAGRVFARGHIFGDDITEWRSIMVRYGPGGTPVDTLEVPSYDLPSSTIFARREGSTSSRNVPFSPGSQWALTSDGSFVSGRSDVYAVHKGLDEGMLLRMERDAPAVPVSSAERSEQEELATYSMRRTQPSWRWNGPSIPDVKPYFRTLKTGADGRIWVQLSQPGELNPEADTTERLPDQAPSVRYREPQVWDVFSPNGRFLGQIELPHGFNLHVMRGDYVWGVQRDELDVQSVVRARIDPPLGERALEGIASSRR